MWQDSLLYDPILHDQKSFHFSTIEILLCLLVYQLHQHLDETSVTVSFMLNEVDVKVNPLFWLMLHFQGFYPPIGVGCIDQFAPWLRTVLVLWFSSGGCVRQPNVRWRGARQFFS